MAEVSIIVPVYNAELYLRECLDSIVTQTMTDIEIVCVNDGSTDSSAEILREYVDRDTRVTLIESENSGVSAARNRGFDATSGRYVLFLDADDFFEPTMVEEVYLRCVEDDADIGVFRIRYLYMHRDLAVDAEWSLRTDLIPAKTPFSRKDMSASIFSAITPCVWNKMFKREFLVETGLRFPADLRRSEDVPFTYLALALARRVTVVDKPLVNYRTGIVGTQQSTLHERPLDICRALAITKTMATAAGVFDEIERDYVNAALDQVLHSLSTVTTSEAFCELYGALKARYFAEFGIADRPEDYFFAKEKYDKYVRIMQSPPEAYLLDEIRALSGRVERFIDRDARLSAALNQTREQLDAAREDYQTRKAELRATRKQLDRVTARLDRLESQFYVRLWRAVARIPRAFLRRVKANGRAG